MNILIRRFHKCEETYLSNKTTQRLYALRVLRVKRSATAPLHFATFEHRVVFVSRQREQDVELDTADSVFVYPVAHRPGRKNGGQPGLSATG